MKASTFEAIREGLSGLIEWGGGLTGKSKRSAAHGYAPQTQGDSGWILAKLTSDSNPYTWTGQDASGATFTDGSISGENAYEVNGLDGLEGEIVRLRRGYTDDYRFVYTKNRIPLPLDICGFDCDTCKIAYSDYSVDLSYVQAVDETTGVRTYGTITQTLTYHTGAYYPASWFGTPELNYSPYYWTGCFDTPSDWIQVSFDGTMYSGTRTMAKMAVLWTCTLGLVVFYFNESTSHCSTCFVVPTGHGEPPDSLRKVGTTSNTISYTRTAIDCDEQVRTFTTPTNNYGGTTATVSIVTADILSPWRFKVYAWCRVDATNVRGAYIQNADVTVTASGFADQTGTTGVDQAHSTIFSFDSDPGTVTITVSKSGYFDVSRTWTLQKCVMTGADVLMEDTTYSVIFAPEACQCCRSGGMWAPQCHASISDGNSTQEGDCSSTGIVTLTFDKPSPGWTAGPFTYTVSDTNRCRSSASGTWRSPVYVGMCGAFVTGRFDAIPATIDDCVCGGCGNCREPYPRTLHYSDSLGDCEIVYQSGGIDFGSWVGYYTTPGWSVDPYTHCGTGSGGSDVTVKIKASCSYPTWTVRLSTTVIAQCASLPHCDMHLYHVSGEAGIYGSPWTYYGTGTFTSTGTGGGIVADCNDPVSVTVTYSNQCLTGNCFNYCVAELEDNVGMITE